MKYEFKIKDEREWDEIPVSESDYYSGIMAALSFAKALANKEQREVRMNEEGSRQGHYARPSLKCNGICRPTAMQYDKDCPLHGWD